MCPNSCVCTRTCLVICLGSSSPIYMRAAHARARCVHTPTRYFARRPGAALRQGDRPPQAAVYPLPCGVVPPPCLGTATQRRTRVCGRGGGTSYSPPPTSAPTARPAPPQGAL
ncbi:hypothetical protein EON67_06670 [archaeon]|nr:MAG: hypothetical protein EON67_06670 [archaeon]